MTVQEWEKRWAQLLAEHQRLYREFEYMAEVYKRHEQRSRDRAYKHSLLSQDRQHHLRFAHANKRVHQKITKILEGKP